MTVTSKLVREKNMKTLPDELAYNTLYKIVDSILVEIGIRATCIRCSTICSIYETNHDLGCCTRCKYLSHSGCTIQSLACKLWLCHEIRRVRLPEIYRVLFEDFIEYGCEHGMIIFRDSPFVLHPDSGHDRTYGKSIQEEFPATWIVEAK